MSKNFQTLEQITQLITEIKQVESILEYDNIELPFDLAKKVNEFLASVFTTTILQQLATNDPDTLDAWAIAFRETLENQQKLISLLVSYLVNLPIHAPLKQKLETTSQHIEQIVQQKIAILEAHQTLIDQENQLKQQATELQQLQAKITELNTIKAEVEAINLEQLKTEIATQSALIIPKKQQLESLKQEKVALNKQVNDLQQQEAQQRQEINDLKTRNSQLKITIKQHESEIENQQAEITNRQESLDHTSEEIKNYQTELAELQQQLQTAIDEFNQYQTATEKTRNHLNIHYQTDQELGQILSVNQVKVNRIIQNIQDSLTQLDQELAQAEQLKEKSKDIITFTTN